MSTERLMSSLLLTLVILAGSTAARAGDYTGLWTGMVTVDAVSEPSSSQPERPTPAAGEFTFPVLLHVDDKDRITLLKEAVMLWRAGAAEGEGKYLLVADRQVLARLLSQTDGRPSGRRLSTAAYDFEGATRVVRGDLAPGKVAWVNLDVPAKLPTNPFRHVFHPDHDNRDDAGQPLPEGKDEVFAVERRMEWKFDQAADGPELKGAYRETLTGLHRTPVQVSGRFGLRRVASLSTLER
ncbi:MAG: hypothetical protein KDH88_00665 [Chromatiales bacterium]|nr:hypothetical protein [Chromatiales bacterium]